MGCWLPLGGNPRDRSIRHPLNLCGGAGNLQVLDVVEGLASGVRMLGLARELEGKGVNGGGD